MAKLINKHGIISKYVFNSKYDVMSAPTYMIKKTDSWYIIPNDALLEGL